MASIAPHYQVPVLSQANSLISSISVPVLHPTWLPIPALTLIHALRVSLGTCQVQGGPRKLPLLQSVVLAWILLFGGWCILNVALAQPCPLLDAGVQWTALVYGLVHAAAVLSGFQSSLLAAIAKSPGGFGLAFDLFVNLIDAVCRADGIISLGVAPVATHTSFLTPLLTSALIGGGGPLLIGLLNLESPDWRLQAPTWLRNPTGLLAVDIWSASVVGLAYKALSAPVLAGDRLPRGLLGPAGPVVEQAGRPLLSHNEAKLVGSVILFSLLTVNRLRVAAASVNPQAVTAKSTPNGTPKKGKKSSSSSLATSQQPKKSALASTVYVAGIFVPLAFLAAQAILSGSSADQVLPGLKPDSKILFLFAHPDDEVMFASPLVFALIAVFSGANLFGISVSTGSAGGIGAADLGRTRAQELVEAYSSMGVPAQNVLALNDSRLQDGMDQSWETQAVVDAVVSAISSKDGTWPARFDAIVTFDDKGISGHANHIGVARAASGVANLYGQSKVWRLTTLSLPFKYGSLPYALVARLSAGRSTSPRCVYVLSSPRGYLRAVRAMQTHVSQLVWFRYGWWLLSSYVFGVEVCLD